MSKAAVPGLGPSKEMWQSLKKKKRGRLTSVVIELSNLPVSQTPIPKRIYTKVHSLNLSLLGLYPESKGVGDRGMEEREG